MEKQTLLVNLNLSKDFKIEICISRVSFIFFVTILQLNLTYAFHKIIFHQYK